MQMECYYFCVLFTLSVIALNAVSGQQSRLASYRIPQPTAAVLSPRGFRISIPDERGIVLYAFHGSINKEIRANEIGDFHGETRIKSQGVWSYETTRYQLQRGDVLHFWIYVQHENFGYKLENQRYVYPDDFRYNSYGTGSNDDTVNHNGNSHDTTNHAATNTDDTGNYNSGVGGNQQQWNQDDTVNSNNYGEQYYQEYTTQRTTTSSPYLVFEDMFNIQYQSTTSTSRPIATRSTTTKRSTATSVSINYWPGSTQRPHHVSQQRPQQTTSQQRPTTSTQRPQSQRPQQQRPQQQGSIQSAHTPQVNSRPTQLETSHQTQPDNYQSTQHGNQRPFQQPTTQHGIGFSGPVTNTPQTNQFSQGSQQGSSHQNSNHGSQGSQQGSNHGSQGSQGSQFSQTEYPYTQSFEQSNSNRPNQFSQTDNQNLNRPNQFSQTGNQFTQTDNSNQNRPQTGNNQYEYENDNQNQNRPTQNCYPSISTVNKKRINCKDTVIFEEQFDYNFQNRWVQDVRMPLEFEDAEFVVYENYPSIWNVSYGNLHIFPKLLYQAPESGFSENDIRTGRFVIDSRDCTSFIDPRQECERQAGSKRILPPIVSAKFRSKKAFSFKFGRVDIRAKVPKGDWIFPQINLEPTENKYRGTGDLPYLNGQIRMAFVRGNELLERPGHIPLDGKILTGICVLSGGDQIRDIARKSNQIGHEHFGNDFHTYSIIWTNSSVRFMVDDLEYGTDTGGYKNLPIQYANYWQTGTNMAPFDQEFHVALGVGVGGNADFPDDSLTGWSKLQKPWENTSPKAELSFYLHADEWHPTWNSRESGLVVDYVKVTSV